MRTGETNEVPLRADKVPLLRLRDGVLEDAKTITGKRYLLLGRLPEDKFYSVWPGKWSSDTFVIDPEVALDILREV